MSEADFGNLPDPDFSEPEPEPPPPDAGPSDEPDWGGHEPEPEAEGIDPSELDPYPDDETGTGGDDGAVGDGEPDEPDWGDPTEPPDPEPDPPYAGEPDEPDWGDPTEPPDPEPDEPTHSWDDGGEDVAGPENSPTVTPVGEPFWWEADPEPQGEEVAVRGETVISFDDAAETVTITGPDGESDTRPYEAPEQTRRAASIFATKLRAQLEQTRAELETQLGEMQANLDAATEIIAQGPRSITVSHRDPTASDAEGRPDGALWEVRSEPEHGPVVTLRRWYLLRGAWVQTEIMGNLVVPGTIDANKVRMDEAWADKIAANIGTFQSAFIGKLAADMIRADSYRGQVISGATIISSDSDDPNAENVTISDRTIAVNRDDGEGGLMPTLTIGGSRADEIQLRPSSKGQPTVQILGSTGEASFNSVSTDSLLVGGDDIVSYIDDGDTGILTSTWGSGAALPDVGASEYGLVRLKWPIKAGRWYRVCADLKVQGKPGAVIQFWLRHSAAAGDATVTSAHYGMWQYQLPSTSSNGSFHISTLVKQDYSHPNYNMLFTMRLHSGNGPVRLWDDGGNDRSQSYFWVEDLGERVSNASAVWTSGGGKPYASTPPPPPPPPQKRTYTRTYQAASAFSWRDSAEVSDVLHHGTHQGVRRVSQVVFPAQVQQDLTGATIKKVEVRLKNLHTYYGAGMTASLVPATNHAKSSTPTGASKTNETRVQWGKGQTKFVTLKGWKANTRSVYLGWYADSSGQFYGKFSRALSDCVLRVTYEK